MNFTIIIFILGWVLIFEAAFMSLPCIVALIYGETTGFTYLFVMLACAVAGIVITRFKPKNKAFYAREGFVTVSLSWILLSVIGAIPFIITGEIPSFTDAMFETASGFTTTGATILTDVEVLSQCSLFWRSFTHWVGGMGVLVFILAMLPLSGANNIHLMRAESPGPSVSKLAPRVRSTALILYAIYIALTLLEIVALLIAGMPLFEALTTAFGTAGTGGFGVKNNSIEGYTAVIQWIVTVFMLLFGINFTVYYLLLIKKFRQAFGSEEVRTYFIIVIVAIAIITADIASMYRTFGEALRQSAFHVSSIITTTGFSIGNFDNWPTLSKTVLVLLMFIGACAGSTGGGVKVQRAIIGVKCGIRQINNYIHPRNVKSVMLDGRQIEDATVKSVHNFFLMYIVVFTASLIIISIDNMSFVTNFSAVAATLNNIGPGLDAVGPIRNFSTFSGLSKWVLIFDMIAGRLELFPVLVLFAPSTWTKL